eukprot:8543985-Alexandrium_andersonii.AAC.1
MALRPLPGRYSVRSVRSPTCSAPSIDSARCPPGRPEKRLWCARQLVSSAGSASARTTVQNPSAQTFRDQL